MDVREPDKASKIPKDDDHDEGSDADSSSGSVDCDFSIYKAKESSDDDRDSLTGTESDGSKVKESLDKSVDELSRDGASDSGHGPMAKDSIDGYVNEGKDEDISTASDDSHGPMARGRGDASIDVYGKDLSIGRVSDDSHSIMTKRSGDASIGEDNEDFPTGRGSVCVRGPMSKGRLIESEAHSEDAQDEASYHSCHTKSRKIDFLIKESFTNMKQKVKNTQYLGKCISNIDALNTSACPILPPCLSSFPTHLDKPSAMASFMSETKANHVKIGFPTSTTLEDTGNQGLSVVQTSGMFREGRSRRKRRYVTKVCNTETKHMISATKNPEMVFSQSTNLSLKESCSFEEESAKSTKVFTEDYASEKSDLQGGFIKQERQDEEDMCLENCVVSFGNQDKSSKDKCSGSSSEEVLKYTHEKSRKVEMDPRLLSYLQLNAKKNTKKNVGGKRTEKKNLNRIEKKIADKIENRIAEKIEKKNAKKVEKKKDSKEKNIKAVRSAEVEKSDAVLFSFTPQELFEVIIEEKSEAEFVCRNCKKNFAKKDEAFAHMDDHHPFKCNICTLKFMTLNLLESHNSAEHNEIFRCPYCAMISTSSGGLHRHILVKHKGQPATALSLAICHICGKSFNENIGFKTHMEQVHQEAAPLKVDQFHCPVCSKVFRSNNGLRRHMDFHAGRVQTCPFLGCSFRAQYKAHMEIHCNQIHLGINLLPCPFEGCPKKARRKVELEDHLNMVHYKIKNFECESCGRKFTSKKYLTVHELIHTDSKPLACNFCDYRCRQRSALSWHMKKKHSDETEDKREPPHKLFGSRFRPVLKPGRKPKNEEEAPKQKRMKLVTDYKNTEERLVDEFLKNVIQSKEFASAMDSGHIALASHGESQNVSNPSHVESESNPSHVESGIAANPEGGK